MTRVFLDANVIFAAADSKKGAAHVLVRLAKQDDHITLLASEYTIEEAARIVHQAEPQLLSAFDEVREQLNLCLEPSEALVANLNSLLPSGTLLPNKDLPVLGGAIAAGADWLLTHDANDFGPLYGKNVCGVEILRPGTALRRLSSFEAGES